ncbi:MAG: MBL fold metallo-hydrolase [Asgard group archaeon]|nr:MBL fold metallo-hydrolase [Asgard group archaeon]
MSGQVIDIGKSVVMYEMEHNTNIICIELQEGLVFVDSGRMDDVAKKFRKDMEMRFSKKATHLLLTHYHHDHICGMSAFKDCEIVGCETGHQKFLEDLKGNLSLESRKAQVERWKVMAVELKWKPSKSRDLLWKYYPKVELLPPTKAADEFVIASSEQKVIFQRVGGHSECSAMIHVPLEEIVILGDNIVGDPTKVGGCFFGGLDESIVGIYDEVAKFKPKTIIPGHGPITDLPYMKEAGAYFKKLFKSLREMYDTGVKPTEVASYKDLPEFYDEKPDYWDSALERLYQKISSEMSLKEIDKIHVELNQASFENDGEKILNFYAKDFVVTVSNGFFVRGADDFKRCFRPTNYVDIKNERLDHFFLGDKFIEKIATTSKTNTNGTEQTTESEAVHIWIRENADWKIQSDIRLGSKDIE